MAPTAQPQAAADVLRERSNTKSQARSNTDYKASAAVEVAKPLTTTRTSIPSVAPARHNSDTIPHRVGMAGVALGRGRGDPGLDNEEDGADAVGHWCGQYIQCVADRYACRQCMHVRVRVFV